MLILDKGLKDWILPDFTTTTKHDSVISAVMMMSTLKAYFTYRMLFGCGLPSVTLEGEKEDWMKLLRRIDRLHLFGKEPEAWAAMLRPILTRFVNAFDGNPDVDFWNHVCHYRSMGSGSRTLTGWLSAFSVWDETGRWRGTGEVSVQSILRAAATGNHQPSLLVTPVMKEKYKNFMEQMEHSKIWTLHLDGIAYGAVDVEKITPGYCEVDVKVDDWGEKFDCMMVSGHVAVRVEGGLLDAIRPHPAWFMFVKK
ncbi:hypothetical protein D9619_010584 [Psilocybe cf. subviscida]|uniref:Uncharacterized protein n=1 Tax=Psilocybe cf. subviscida TaxID=2480587 RepID=A0A8H5ERW4_9AGAR|nr:hypothetical protein D9619_010584 [Psilocybe cf. subviscida]